MEVANELMLRGIVVGVFQENCWVIGSRRTGEGLCVDPGDQPDEILALARDMGVNIKLIVNSHAHIDDAQGAVLNPGGLTQYSVSLHDCIKAMPFPVMEAHLSNLAAREEWRHRSIIAPACRGTVTGLGWRSYTAALRALVETLQD